MAGPLVYVGLHGIKDGKLEVAKEASENLVKFLEANHPAYLLFEISFSDDGSEMRVVQLHRDEDSLVLHLQLAGEKIAAAYEFLEGTKSIQIFGDPSEALFEKIQMMAMGAPLSVNRASFGFSRL